MTKREVFQLLSMIACYYEQFVVDQAKVDAWTRVLRNNDFDPLEKNLLTHVTESAYPPKISELVRKGGASAQAIPDDIETEISLKQNETKASAEVANEHLKKMRAILGIRREEC